MGVGGYTINSYIAMAVVAGSRWHAGHTSS
jgi:hypothetical protein